MRTTHACALACALWLAAAPASAQPAATRAAADVDAAALGRGWTALSTGNREGAARAADEVLGRHRAHHAAVQMKIEAQSDRPEAALTTYESWLTAARTEDIFLLASVARATLEAIAAGSDPALQAAALDRLARAGVASAEQRLRGLPSAATVDVTRALDGDAAAAARLIEPSRATGIDPMTLAQALPAAGAAAEPALRTLLDNPAPPVRMLAAIGLGKIGATGSADALAQLLDSPELRDAAAIALVRLGDARGAAIVQELLRSEAPDVRLFAAEAYDHRKPGPWVEAILPALTDPNGLTRIRAAEALRDVAPASALPVLRDAAADANPVVRGDVSRVLERFTDPSAQAGLDMLRRMLRDPDASVRMHAAGTILQRAGRG